jgi:hypothetical protein
VSLAFTAKIQNDAKIIKGNFRESTGKQPGNGKEIPKTGPVLTFGLYLLQKMG